MSDYEMYAIWYTVPFLTVFVLGIIFQRVDPEGGWKPLGFMALIPLFNMIVMAFVVITALCVSYKWIIDLLYGPDKSADIKNKKSDFYRDYGY